MLYRQAWWMDAFARTCRLFGRHLCAAQDWPGDSHGKIPGAPFKERSHHFCGPSRCLRLGEQRTGRLHKSYNYLPNPAESTNQSPHDGRPRHPRFPSNTCRDMACIWWPSPTAKPPLPDPPIFLPKRMKVMGAAINKRLLLLTFPLFS